MNHPDLPPDDPLSTEEGLLCVHSFLVANDKASKLGDRELLDLITTHVWGNLPVGSYADVLLTELIVRFEEAKGIEDTDEYLAPNP